MLATYERKKVTEYTSFKYEFKVFYKDEYVCDLLKVDRKKWMFSAFRPTHKSKGLQDFLYCNSYSRTFQTEKEATDYLENFLSAYEASERLA
ncbi:hypothetical protein [Parasutterella excrementihominis]|uniref:hypothetical protein n=1 Tax=Parasutterella excrementihominis TaxID=487175 RepID=UPI0022E62E14|nr:hypothetical protein [Parasutterella excrementihominis]